MQPSPPAQGLSQLCDWSLGTEATPPPETDHPAVSISTALGAWTMAAQTGSRPTTAAPFPVARITGPGQRGLNADRQEPPGAQSLARDGSRTCHPAAGRCAGLGQAGPGRLESELPWLSLCWAGPLSLAGTWLDDILTGASEALWQVSLQCHRPACHQQEGCGELKAQSRPASGLWCPHISLQDAL